MVTAETYAATSRLWSGHPICMLWGPGWGSEREPEPEPELQQQPQREELQPGLEQTSLHLAEARRRRRCKSSGLTTRICGKSTPLKLKRS